MAYIRALFQQSVTTIDEMSPGAVASRLTTNSNIIESGISQQFFLAVQAISFTIGLFVFAFIKNALLTAVALSGKRNSYRIILTYLWLLDVSRLSAVIWGRTAHEQWSL